MRKLLNHILTGAAITLGVHTVCAAQDSYIYLESDRNTGFFARLDNTPIAKPGTYHLFIPSIESGQHDMSILFADNSAPLNFNVNVVSGKGYGYFLSKDKDGNYCLQSMQMNRRYYDGDTINEALPSIASAPAREKATAKPVKEKAEKEPKPTVVAAAKIPKEKPPVVKKEKKAAVKETGDIVTEDKTFARTKPAVTNEGPQFMDNIVLESGNGTEGKKKKKPEPIKEPEPVAQQDSEPSSNQQKVPNSDCPEPVDDVQFEKLVGILDRRYEDQDRIEFLKSKIKQYCYSTTQIRQMAGIFKTQSGRFVMVKMLYPRTVDANNFASLQNLFDSDTYLEKFNALVQ